MGDECPCDACACRSRMDFTVTVKGHEPARLLIDPDTLIHRQRSYIEWLEHQVGYFPHALEMRERLGL